MCNFSILVIQSKHLNNVNYKNPVSFCQGDPLLSDLHTAVTLEEINSQIALEYGQAMTVNVLRLDGQVLRKYDTVICIVGKLHCILFSRGYRCIWVGFNGIIDLSGRVLVSTFVSSVCHKVLLYIVFVLVIDSAVGGCRSMNAHRSQLIIIYGHMIATVYSHDTNKGQQITDENTSSKAYQNA